MSRKNPGQKFIWSRESEIILITEIKEKPQLWDPSHPDYAKAHKKSAQWEEIAKKLGTYFNATMVKDRFDNMRTTFQRNHNKVKDSMRSGKGTDDIFEPKWELYNQLTFLKKSYAQASSLSNLDIENEFVDSQQSNTESSAIFLEEDRDVYFDHTLKQWVLIPDDTGKCDKYTDNTPESTIVVDQQSSSSPVMLPKSSSIPERPNSAPESFSAISTQISSKRSISNPENEELYVKRGKKGGKPNIMEEALAIIKDLSHEPNVQMDACDHFGAYIAARLRCLNTKQQGEIKLEIKKLFVC